MTLKSGLRLFGEKSLSARFDLWPLARIKCLATNRHKVATNRQHESRKPRNGNNFLQRPKRSRGRETNEVKTRRQRSPLMIAPSTIAHNQHLKGAVQSRIIFCPFQTRFKTLPTFMTSILITWNEKTVFCSVFFSFKAKSLLIIHWTQNRRCIDTW